MENAMFNRIHRNPAMAEGADLETREATRKRSLFELLIRGDITQVNRGLLEQPLAPQLQQFIVLSLVGLAIHGTVVAAVASALRPAAIDVAAMWTLPLALPLSLLLALAICLPSFFFYTQLAGLDASFRLVTAQALRSMASGATYLLGALPFYGAYALAYVVGIREAGPEAAETVVKLGVYAPFIVGLFGVRVLYLSFRDLLSVVPITHERRGRFLLRMIVAWAGVFMAVAPLALYRLIELLGRGM